MKKLIGLLFLFGWASGELLRVTGKIPINLMDVAAVLLIVEILATKGYSFRTGKLGELAVAGGMFLCSWLLGLRLFSVKESMPGFLYSLRIFGYFMIISRAKELFNPVKKWIHLALSAFVVLGLGQYLFFPDTRFLLRYGWDEHYYRLIGTVLDPNYMGAMLGVILIFSASQFLKTKKRKWGILGILGISGLALTFSRASWLATGISGLLVLKKQKQVGKLGILVALGILGIYLLAPKPGGEGVNLIRVSSIKQRLNSWQQGISVWKGHPWLGVGFNNYKIAKAAPAFAKASAGRQAAQTTQEKHAENAPSNSWILMLDTLGILGVLGTLGVLGKKIRNVSPVWGGIAALLSIHAVFNNTLFYTPVLGLIVLIRAASEE